MERALIVILILICLQWSCHASHAANPMNVRVAVGKVSEVVFPEKVAKVIKGGAIDSVLVEVLDTSVYVLPKSNAPSDIFVTGISGESYPLNLIISPEHDLRVEIKGSSAHRISQDTKTDAIDLIKEVLLGREPAGATVLKSGQSMILNAGQIEMSVETIYDFPHVAAYVFKAQNLINNSVIVPIEQLSFPNLLAVASDQDMLNPQGQEGSSTKVYVIAGK